MNANWGDWWREKKKSQQEFLWAAESGDLPKLKKYLDKSIMQGMVADVNGKGLDQWTALHFASNEGHTIIIKELLKQPGIDLESMSTIQRTPLHIAALKGHLDCVRALVEKGANPSCRDFDESTPLHYAAEFGSINIIIFLIKESDANPSLKNKFGYEPSDIAQNNDVRKVFQSLLGKKPVGQQQTGDPMQSNRYGRTAFNGVLMHNDRINSVQKLMAKYQNVDKYLSKINYNEQQLIKNLET